MSEESLKPDFPFRNGISGKYKLLIRNVTSKARGYEYELVDADGKEYKTRSELHYAEGGILRCMVIFEVTNARLMVSDTVVCKKQDLATLIPEAKRAKPTIQPKSMVNPNRKASVDHLGDPIKDRVSGSYKLRVIQVDEEKKHFIYHLVDAMARIYRTQSKRYFAVGQIVPCHLHSRITKNGVQAYVVSMGSSSEPRKKIKSRSGSNSGYSQSSWPVPAVGDHFHLIYTPMGNKR